MGPQRKCKQSKQKQEKRTPREFKKVHEEECSHQRHSEQRRRVGDSSAQQQWRERVVRLEGRCSGKRPQVRQVSEKLVQKLSKGCGREEKWLEGTSQ